MSRPRLPRRRLARLGGALVCGATSLGLLGTPPASASGPSGQVAIVAYSTPAPAFGALIRQFNKTKAGKNITFTQSYGASGSQAKAVIAGQPADIVNFSRSTDMESLVVKNLVSASWNDAPSTKGMVTDSVVAFAVPKGNPKHIKSWADLLKPGIRIFTPNPFSSGGATWNLLAAYGVQLKLGDSQTQAKTYLTSLLKDTVVQGTSAAVELQDFLSDESSNKNDVLLDYESDLIQAKRAGKPIDYVIPKQDLLIENPIAVTTSSGNSAAANAFVSFLLSPAGQTEWAKLGYRPTLPSVAAKTRNLFTHPAQLFTIEWLGGWDQVVNQFFSTSKSSPGIVTAIESGLGQTT